MPTKSLEQLSPQKLFCRVESHYVHTKLSVIISAMTQVTDRWRQQDLHLMHFLCTLRHTQAGTLGGSNGGTRSDTTRACPPRTHCYHLDTRNLERICVLCAFQTWSGRTPSQIYYRLSVRESALDSTDQAICFSSPAFPRRDVAVYHACQFIRVQMRGQPSRTPSGRCSITMRPCLAFELEATDAGRSLSKNIWKT